MSPAVQFILHVGCKGHDFWALGCYHRLIPDAIHLFKKMPTDHFLLEERTLTILFFYIVLV